MARTKTVGLIGLLSMTVFAALLWALTVDLRPDGDVAAAWSVVGCAGHFDCVNEDVETHDGDTTYLIDSDTSGVTDEFSFTNVPGDFGSLNSLTLKLVVRVNATNDDNDRIDVILKDNGTPVGGTKCASDNDAACACNITGTTYTACSFTDAAWDSLSGTSLNALSVALTTVNNQVGMPDTTTFRVTAVEAALDYNEQAAGRPRRPMVVIQ